MTTGSVYVTGMGVVSCLGSGVDKFWRALCEGRNGLGELTRFDLGGCPYAVAGEVKDFPSRSPGECGLSLGAQFAATAAEAALAEFPEEFRHSLALVLATNFGPAEVFEAALGSEAMQNDAGYRLHAGPFAEDARRVAARLGAGGPLANISLSCASGNAAAVYALDLIRNGRCDAALACGYDSIQRLSWAGLSCLRVMALPSDDGPTLVRPFDRDRAGTIFSEGAGCLLIESVASVERRGAAVLAELAGGATNNNAYHLTHADEEGKGTTAVIKAALADADVSPDEIDHINAHGTATRLNDSIETRAFYTVFGERAAQVPVVSNKGGLGHGMGASSAFEAIASVLSIRTGRIPPTLNHENAAPDCNLNVVSGEVREAPVSTVLNNSSGIGGANAALVLRRVERIPPGGKEAD